MNWSRSWSKFCDSGRIVPSRHVALPDHGVGLDGMKTLKLREFEAKPKPEAKAERQIQRTVLWYGLDRWEETRLHWERTSSVVGKMKTGKGFEESGQG
ncbi:hypothetical protein F2Q69_00038080 [Brassica cretica]|uniref:Uncharacterized protein n=1 Tax=Brassica cretica TaxID=69181 RepID=A0A8S9SB84_BRACR|nr:hypothetical protein F2Q69_00038080 [Brassica cretica]